MRKILALIVVFIMVASVAYSAQQTPVSTDTFSEAMGKIDNNDDDAYSHAGSTSNPHTVTAEQLSLGNVDNTSDADKPVSTAQQTALDLKQNILTEGAFVDGDKTNLDNQSGTNTGDQDLSGKQDADDDLTDLADGTLSGSKLGTPSNSKGALPTTSGVTDGYVPKKQSDGSVAWAADSTGAGGDQLVDVVTTSPILINGGANVNDILPGSDADITISMPAATNSTPGHATAEQITAIEANSAKTTYPGPTAWDDIVDPDAASEIDTGTHITELNVDDFRIGDGGLNYIKFSDTGITLHGSYAITMDFTFADQSTSPDSVGLLLYDNDVTGLDDGAFAYYDDDEVKYFLDYATLPSTDGQIVIYNATTDKWVPLVLSGDATITNGGVLTIEDDAITPAKVASGAYDVGTSLEANTLTEGGLAVPVSSTTARIWTADDCSTVTGMATGDVCFEY